MIVIVGVFIGTQVSNWNQERLEKREKQRMLVQLNPQIQVINTFFISARDYYETTRTYAATAIAGWRNDPKVSDVDFVIAAYQASQIYTLGTNSSTWSAILGVDQVRNIDDRSLRANLAILMSADYSQRVAEDRNAAPIGIHHFAVKMRSTRGKSRPEWVERGR